MRKELRPCAQRLLDTRLTLRVAQIEADVSEFIELMRRERIDPPYLTIFCLD